MLLALGEMQYKNNDSNEIHSNKNPPPMEDLKDNDTPF